MNSESSLNRWYAGLIDGRICYRGADCLTTDLAGVWALYMNHDVSFNDWRHGFNILYRICYRGANCQYASSVGIWALNLSGDASTSNWSSGLRLI